MIREYWLIFHNSMSDQDLTGIAKEVHGSILELTMDGEAALWPVSPHTQTPGTHELCEVCTRYLSPLACPDTNDFRAGCLSGKEQGRPCAFAPAPEALDHQDFDNLLIDGSPILTDGIYGSPGAFLHGHALPIDQFVCFPLGVHSGIRACRDFFAGYIE